MLRQLANSFKLKWYTLLYDTSFVIIAAVLFSLMGVYIQTKSTVLGQGKNPEQIQQMVQWLNQQVVHSNESINEAHQTNNYCKETQFEGMRDAFMRCLNKLNNA